MLIYFLPCVFSWVSVVEHKLGHIPMDVWRELKRLSDDMDISMEEVLRLAVNTIRAIQSYVNDTRDREGLVARILRSGRAESFATMFVLAEEMYERWTKNILRDLGFGDRIPRLLNISVDPLRYSLELLIDLPPRKGVSRLVLYKEEMGWNQVEVVFVLYPPDMETVDREVEEKRETLLERLREVSSSEEVVIDAGRNAFFHFMYVIVARFTNLSWVDVEEVDSIVWETLELDRYNGS